MEHMAATQEPPGVVQVRVELEAETNAAVADWAKRENRSKRGQAAFLLERLAKLREQRPDALASLGLLTADDGGRAA